MDNMDNMDMNCLFFIDDARTDDHENPVINTAHEFI